MRWTFFSWLRRRTFLKAVQHKGTHRGVATVVFRRAAGLGAMKVVLAVVGVGRPGEVAADELARAEVGEQLSGGGIAQDAGLVCAGLRAAAVETRVGLS